MYMITWVKNDKDYFFYTLTHAPSPSPHTDKNDNK